MSYTTNIVLVHISMEYAIKTIYYICIQKVPSWSWSYGRKIYNYMCNQCLSLLTLWVRMPLRRSVLDTTICGKVCQWLATGQWFSPGTAPIKLTTTT